MEIINIIYKYIAADGTTTESSLSHYTRSYSVYPVPFVADYWSSSIDG